MLKYLDLPSHQNILTCKEGPIPENIMLVLQERTNVINLLAKAHICVHIAQINRWRFWSLPWKGEFQQQYILPAE